MTLVFALRGTVAMLVPFVVLFELGIPAGAVFATLGGMFAVLADSGDNYSRRIGAMVISLMVGAAALFVGCVLPPIDWLTPLVLAVVAFAAGISRAFGGAGISVGLSASILFLVGTFAPRDALHAAESAGFYALGGLWVIGLQVALWRLRPYRVLLNQIAACFDAGAALVAALAPEVGDPHSTINRRRVRALHQSAREAIRTADSTLEAVRLGTGHSSPFLDRCLLLLACISREIIAATSLRTLNWSERGTEAADAWLALFASWRCALESASHWLLTGRGEVSMHAMRAAFDRLERLGVLAETQRAPLRLALFHMDAVADAGTRFSGLRFSWREVLPKIGFRGLQRARDTIVAQFTFRSIIFRHALRVAVAAGFGFWLSIVLDVPHRLWLPMTTIIVLQPEFGATWRRLWQRMGGTLAGVLIAGALLFVVHGTIAELVVIAVFAFGNFYFIRIHYGIGVTLLTPMVLLLLGVLEPAASGVLVIARGVDTLAGGAIALAAAYLLWPLWQRGAFVPQCAVALRAQRDYLMLAFDQPGDGALSRPELMKARHDAERASDNADATLRRMLAEPRAAHHSRAALAFMTYLRRLADNATNFAVELHGERLSEEERERGDEILQRIGAIAHALRGEAPPESLADIRPQLRSTPSTIDKSTSSTTDARSIWFQRMAADTAALAVSSRKLLRR